MHILPTNPILQSLSGAQETSSAKRASTTTKADTPEPVKATESAEALVAAHVKSQKHNEDESELAHRVLAKSHSGRGRVVDVSV